MAQIAKLILNAAGMVKPLLVKLLPLSLLWKLRSKVTIRSFLRLQAQVKPYQPGHDPKGVNLIGDIRLEAGLGQSCRLVASALEKTGLPFHIYQYTPAGAEQAGDHTWDARIGNGFFYSINLIHINPLELGAAYCRIDRQAWDYRYQIAFWLWELEEFPDEWTLYFQGLDEIWAPSEFTCRAIRKKTSLPVRCMPYYIEAPLKEGCTRKDFGLPKDQFLFLMMYDSRSCMERKNPAAVMHAFQKAFDKTDQNVGLVIKISHCTKEEERSVRSIMQGYKNIYLIRDHLERGEVNSLIRCTDVVVSLHRAEGFGLVLAEAMLLGTPVIATNWSANTEFMDRDTACMVDYKYVTLEKDLLPFHAGNRWADPDPAQAAGYMKKLYEDPAYYKELSERAKAHIQNTLSMEKAAARMRERIEEIYMKKCV